MVRFLGNSRIPGPARQPSGLDKEAEKSAKPRHIHRFFPKSVDRTPQIPSILLVVEHRPLPKTYNALLL